MLRNYFPALGINRYFTLRVIVHISFPTQEDVIWNFALWKFMKSPGLDRESNVEKFHFR